MINDSPATYESEQWLEWYRLTPQERWRETTKLWELYLSVGGSLDPEPDPQSPFDQERTSETTVHVARRSGLYLAIIEQR
jgi:hypothetical protein